MLYGLELCSRPPVLSLYWEELPLITALPGPARVWAALAPSWFQGRLSWAWPAGITTLCVTTGWSPHNVFWLSSRPPTLSLTLPPPPHCLISAYRIYLTIISPNVRNTFLPHQPAFVCTLYQVWNPLYQAWSIFQSLFPFSSTLVLGQEIKFTTNLFEIPSCIKASDFVSLWSYWVFGGILKYTHIISLWFAIIINQKNTILLWYPWTGGMLGSWELIGISWVDLFF